MRTFLFQRYTKTKKNVDSAEGAAYIERSSAFDSSSDVPGTVTTETRFSDFKKTGGILFPRKVEVQAQGRPNKLRLVVNEVEVNPKIPDARFALLETAPAKK